MIPNSLQQPILGKNIPPTDLVKQIENSFNIFMLFKDLYNDMQKDYEYAFSIFSRKETEIQMSEAKLKECLNKSGLLLFSDFQQEISAISQGKYSVRFDELDVLIQEVTQVHVKIPLFSELMKLQNKTTQDLTWIYFKKVSVVPLVVRSLWIAEICGISYQTILANCHLVVDSGIIKELEECMCFFASLIDNDTPRYLLQEINMCIQNNDVDRLSCMFFIFEEMLSTNKCIYSYTSQLKDNKIMIVDVTDGTIAGGILHEAQKALKILFEKDLEGVKRMLRCYELVDQNPDAIPIIDDYLNQDVANRKDLIQELEALIPKKIIAMEMFNSWSVTHVSGGIIIHQSLFICRTPQSIAQVMLTNIHELMHKKNT